MLHELLRDSLAVPASEPAKIDEGPQLVELFFKRPGPWLDHLVCDFPKSALTLGNGSHDCGGTIPHSDRFDEAFQFGLDPLFLNIPRQDES